MHMNLELVDKIVSEVKSQGVFDQFRKDSISDVDTKPAYQNLRQRVETTVSKFLDGQNWRAELNKNQLRERLRKHITEAGFLDTGVERIVDQVVNPKISTVFQPKIEEIAYKYLGIEKPAPAPPEKPNYHTNGTLSIEVDLLPTDLEAVSPDSDRAGDKSESKSNNDSSFLESNEDKNEEFESPPFEPLEGITRSPEKPEESNHSHLSGISGLTSQDSINSDKAENTASKEVPELDPESELSQVSSNSRLSIVTNEGDADESQEQADVNISEEAQMPKFNESSDSTDVNRSGSLHFNINEQKINFEGVEQKDSEKVQRSFQFDSISDTTLQEGGKVVKSDSLENNGVEQKSIDQSTSGNSVDTQESISSKQSNYEKDLKTLFSESSSHSENKKSPSKRERESSKHSEKDSKADSRSSSSRKHRRRRRSSSDEVVSERKRDSHKSDRHRHRKSKSNSPKRSKSSRSEKSKRSDDHNSARLKSSRRKSTDSNDGDSLKEGKKNSSTSSSVVKAEASKGSTNGSASNNPSKTSSPVKDSSSLRQDLVELTKSIVVLDEILAGNDNNANVELVIKCSESTEATEVIVRESFTNPDDEEMELEYFDLTDEEIKSTKKLLEELDVAIKECRQGNLSESTSSLNLQLKEMPKCFVQIEKKKISNPRKRSVSVSKSSEKAALLKKITNQKSLEAVKEGSPLSGRKEVSALPNGKRPRKSIESYSGSYQLFSENTSENPLMLSSVKLNGTVKVENAGEKDNLSFKQQVKVEPAKIKHFDENPKKPLQNQDKNEQIAIVNLPEKKSSISLKASQRYTSEDLYKPRPIILGQRSKRRAIDADIV